MLVGTWSGWMGWRRGSFWTYDYDPAIGIGVDELAVCYHVSGVGEVDGEHELEERVELDVVSGTQRAHLRGRLSRRTSSFKEKK